MKKFALIVAGGSGRRLNNNIPKQFIEVAGRAVIMHTIDIFLNYNKSIEIILVIPKNQLQLWNELCRKYNFDVNAKIVFGGETRFDSVKNGLDLITGNGVVFIHDGVRPLVSLQTIQNCYETAAEKGNALPVVQVSESVRVVEGLGNKAVDRAKYFLVQTPQTFQTGLIKKAYKQATSNLFTDDASVLESYGEFIHMVEGNRENIKITYPEDLVFAATFLKKNSGNVSNSAVIR